MLGPHPFDHLYGIDESAYITIIFGKFFAQTVLINNICIGTSRIKQKISLQKEIEYE